MKLSDHLLAAVLQVHLADAHHALQLVLYEYHVEVAVLCSDGQHALPVFRHSSPVTLLQK